MMLVPRQEEGLKEFEEKVFKSWFLAHVYHPDCIIARSMMSSIQERLIMRVPYGEEEVDPLSPIPMNGPTSSYPQ